MSERIIRRVVIRGRVQGVGYRDWTGHAAHERGIEGWVRNRRDGTVEAVFAGAREAVSAMIAACRRGPQSSRVEWIEEHDGADSDLELRRADDRFSVIPTA